MPMCDLDQLHCPFFRSVFCPFFFCFVFVPTSSSERQRTAATTRSLAFFYRALEGFLEGFFLEGSLAVLWLSHET